MSGLRERLDDEVIRYLVGRAIVCPLSGVVLDVRTAAVLRGPNGDPVAVLSRQAAEGLSSVTMERFAARGVTVDTRRTASA